MSLSKELIAASTTPIILAILKKHDSYGYEIIKKVKELSEDKMHWTEGMLYPVLHRLEKQDAIESYWSDSINKRKRKYYRIKKKGNEILKETKKEWLIVHETLIKSWSFVS